MSEPVKDFGFERRQLSPGQLAWIRKAKYYDCPIITVTRHTLSVELTYFDGDMETARRFCQLLQLAIRVHEQLKAGVNPEEVDFK